MKFNLSKIIKRLMYIGLFIFPFITVVGQQSNHERILTEHKVEEDDDIMWRERNITKEDFLLKSNPSSKILATSCTGIFMIRRKEFNMEYRAMAIFSKSRSVINPKLFTKVIGYQNYLIAHEQLHFDITEVCTRALNSDLERLHVTDNKIATKLYNKYQDIWNNLEEAYDEQTNNGNDIEQQEIWHNRIKTLLEQSITCKSN
jgi:hypothetical protein